MSRPTADDARREAAIDKMTERYVDSDRFVSDALDWLSNTSDLPSDLVDLACLHYRSSADFDTAIDDMANGDREAA